MDVTLERLLLSSARRVPVPSQRAALFAGDSLQVMAELADLGFRVPLIFADPPYFLSNGGISCHAGKMTSVNKGDWDRGESFSEIISFHRNWLSRALALLEKGGTLWVSATQHSVFIIGSILQEMGCIILNDITWEKPNPPPNLSCRYFTHSTETILWVKKNKLARHCFNYQSMREMNGGKQMKTVWRFPAPSRNEKRYGKHPTQKPIALLERVILAASHPNDIILDPFAGSSTTGVAALQTGRRYLGIEKENAFLELSQRRLGEFL